MSDVERVLTVSNQLGEGPIWHPEEAALYWVDIDEQKIFRFYPSTEELEVFDVDVRVTALAIRASGGFVTATDKGLAYWDTRTRELSFIADPEAEKASNRFNDGAVDRQGRFWAGTMNEVTRWKRESRYPTASAGAQTIKRCISRTPCAR
jgi:sugar lactone lactonase YvrE